MASWKHDVWLCVQHLDKRVFTLSDMRLFEDELKVKHPKNQNVAAKVRQQLQFLRDDGYIDFVDNDGTYRRLK